MKLRSLTIDNFMSHEKTHLDLSNTSVCSIIGGNGAGKSTILEAIAWALFGVAKLPNRELIRSGQTSAHVVLAFEMNGKLYQADRRYTLPVARKKEGQHDLKFTIDGKEVSPGGTYVQGDEIVKHLGVSKELVTQSIIVAQGQLSSFLDAQPAERRDLIQAMLLLERYDRAAIRANDHVRKVVAANEVLRLSRKAAEDKLAALPPEAEIGLQVAAVEGKMAELTKQMQALLDRREALVAQDQGYRTLLSQLQERTTQAQALLTKKTAESSFEISDIESSIKRAETDISFIPQYQRRVQELDAEIKKAEEVSAKVQECMGRQQALNRSLQDYQQRVTVASQATGTCPVCGEKIPAERWQEILAGMKTEMGKLVVELSEIDRFLKTSMQMHSPAQLRMEMESQQNKVTQATGKVVTRQELMDRLVRAKEKRDQTLKELADNLNELTQRSDETRGKLNAEVEVLASQIETLKRGHKELNDQMLAWVGTRVTRENAELDRRDAEKTLELNQQLEVSVQFIASALAPAGIPLMILDHRLPVLEARARDLLSKMSNGRLDLKMSVIDSASKKGIDLFAGSSVLRPIKALSGGEQTRVALAIRMALSRMLAEMAGTRFDVLIVDEPPYLDPEGIDQLIESLTRLQGQFSQMFVVSHEEKLRDAFPQTIVVTNQNGISTAMIPSR